MVAQYFSIATYVQAQTEKHISILIGPIDRGGDGALWQFFFSFNVSANDNFLRKLISNINNVFSMVSDKSFASWVAARYFGISAFLGKYKLRKRMECHFKKNKF